MVGTESLARAVEVLAADAWRQAHEIVQNENSTLAAWLHGIVHSHSPHRGQSGRVPTRRLRIGEAVRGGTDARWMGVSYRPAPRVRSYGRG